MKNEDETGSVTHDIFLRVAAPGDAASISEVLLVAFLPFKQLYTEEAFEAPPFHLQK